MQDRLLLLNMVIRNFTTSELKEELDRRERGAMAPPRRLPNPNFKELMDQISSSVEEMSKVNVRAVKDFEHGVFEMTMDTIYGKEIWAWWNNPIIADRRR